jgi:hypothetical protein
MSFFLIDAFGKMDDMHNAKKKNFGIKPMILKFYKNYAKNIPNNIAPHF